MKKIARKPFLNAIFELSSTARNRPRKFCPMVITTAITMVKMYALPTRLSENIAMKFFRPMKSQVPYPCELVSE